MMIEKTAHRKTEIEWKVSHRRIRVETLRLFLSGDRRRRDDQRRLRPHFFDGRHHRPRGDRFTDRHRVQPEIMRLRARAIEARALAKIGDVLSAEDAR